MDIFNDARLEDPAVLEAADGLIRPLATSGARLRRATQDVAEVLDRLEPDNLPRAIIAFGAEARLLRAVLEPTCPIPFVAWPRLGLPGWVGPLDIVVALGATNRVSLTAANEAVRRGAQLLVACPKDSEMAEVSVSRATTLLPAPPRDRFSTAVIALQALQRLGLGPAINTEAIAQAMDDVAIESSPNLDISKNPAKGIALELADAQPLVWGGSVLAARAARRVAEALRQGSGRLALAADAEALLPLLSQVSNRDVFADPFEDDPAERRFGLVILDDGQSDELAVEQRDHLINETLGRGLLVSRVSGMSGDRVERYATVLLKGLFAAAYLEIGLGAVTEAYLGPFSPR